MSPSLNLGSANCPFQPRGTLGNINLDIHACGTEDIRADATALPFRDGTIRIIYAHHLLEHIRREKAAETVREWMRVLVPNGVLSVVIPDWRLLFAMVDLQSLEYRDLFLFGHDDSLGPWQPHQSAWSADEVVNLLCAVGFHDVTLHDPATYHPLVERPRWQGCVRGVK